MFSAGGADVGELGLSSSNIFSLPVNISLSVDSFEMTDVEQILCRFSSLVHICSDHISFSRKSFIGPVV